MAAVVAAVGPDIDKAEGEGAGEGEAAEILSTGMVVEEIVAEVVSLGGMLEADSDGTEEAESAVVNTGTVMVDTEKEAGG